MDNETLSSHSLTPEDAYDPIPLQAEQYQDQNDTMKATNTANSSTTSTSTSSNGDKSNSNNSISNEEHQTNDSHSRTPLLNDSNDSNPSSNSNKNNKNIDNITTIGPCDNNPNIINSIFNASTAAASGSALDNSLKSNDISNPLISIASNNIVANDTNNLNNIDTKSTLTAPDIFIHDPDYFSPNGTGSGSNRTQLIPNNGYQTASMLHTHSVPVSALNSDFYPFGVNSNLTVSNSMRMIPPQPNPHLMKHSQSVRNVYLSPSSNNNFNYGAMHNNHGILSHSQSQLQLFGKNGHDNELSESRDVSRNDELFNSTFQPYQSASQSLAANGAGISMSNEPNVSAMEAPPRRRLRKPSAAVAKFKDFLKYDSEFYRVRSRYVMLLICIMVSTLILVIYLLIPRDVNFTSVSLVNHSDIFLTTFDKLINEKHNKHNNNDNNNTNASNVTEDSLLFLLNDGLPATSNIVFADQNVSINTQFSITIENENFVPLTVDSYVFYYYFDCGNVKCPSDENICMLFLFLLFVV